MYLNKKKSVVNFINFLVKVRNTSDLSNETVNGKVVEEWVYNIEGGF